MTFVHRSNLLFCSAGFGMILDANKENITIAQNQNNTIKGVYKQVNLVIEISYD